MAVSRTDLSAADREVIARFEAAGQGHVFRFLEDLSPEGARRLLDQAAAIDPPAARASAAAATADSTTAVITPPGDELVALTADADGTRRRAAREAGLELLAAGRVAVVIAAGGQGTRLGSDRPKALFPIGPRTGRSLLAWHAAKIRHVAIRTGHAVPLALMLSEATEAATRHFLADYQFFGLDPQAVHTPVQGSLPPIDDDGRLLLERPDRIALAPNGHGGVYRALLADGLADELAAAGITTLAYLQIDNPLIQPLDPVFLGYHALAASRISSKSVAKTDPAERVGVFGRVDGRPAVVEYSELSDEQASARDGDGRLLFGQGNIAAHVIELDFACEMAQQGLPLHGARKKVAYVAENGETIRPSTPNATKFESFLFDAIPLAARSLVVETRREDEFSPIKNATGSDSAATAAADLQRLFVRWYENAGLPLPDGPLEIDPEEAPDEAAFREVKGLAGSA